MMTTASLTALRNAQRLKCELIRRSFQAYGLPWREGKLYNEGGFYFENGTPDHMWITIKSLALIDLNRFIKVWSKPVQFSIITLSLFIDDGQCSSDSS